MDARPSELALDEEALLNRLSPRCLKYSLSSKICKPHVMTPNIFLKIFIFLSINK